jgi:hypothetical protein
MARTKSNGTTQPTNHAQQGPRKRGRKPKVKPEGDDPKARVASPSAGTGAERVRATSSSSNQLASATLSTKQLDRIESQMRAIALKRDELFRVQIELQKLIDALKDDLTAEPKPRKPRGPNKPKADRQQSLPLETREPEDTDGIF